MDPSGARAPWFLPALLSCPGPLFLASFLTDFLTGKTGVLSGFKPFSSPTEHGPTEHTEKPTMRFTAIADESQHKISTAHATQEVTYKQVADPACSVQH